MIILYIVVGMAGRLFKTALSEGDNVLQLKAPQPAEVQPTQQTFAKLDARLARLEAEAVSADAITRARFRNAGL